MTVILCLDCGRRTPSHPSGRCATHRAVIQASIDRHPARRARKRALYGRDHVSLRKAWAPIVAAGAVVCRRCDLPIEPGEEWDLGHGKGSRPEHSVCNRGNRAPPVLTVVKAVR